MRSTLGAVRAMLGYLATQREQGVARWELTTADILDFATQRGAAALGISDRTGTLAEGKLADIVMLNTRSPRLSPTNNPIATIVLQATPADVDTVMVAGQIVKRNGILTCCDAQAVRAGVVNSRDWLMQRGGERLGSNVRSRLSDCGIDRGHTDFASLR